METDLYNGNILETRVEVDFYSGNTVEGSGSYKPPQKQVVLISPESTKLNSWFTQVHRLDCDIPKQDTVVMGTVNLGKYIVSPRLQVLNCNNMHAVFFFMYTWQLILYSLTSVTCYILVNTQQY